MNAFLLPVAAVILGTAIVALVRVVRGPSLTDRTAALQLLGTGGIAVLALIGIAMDLRAAIDLALVLAVLAPLAMIAIFRGAAKSTT